MDGIVYVSSPDLVRLASGLPKVPGRAALVAELITAYELEKRMEVVEPAPVCGLQLRDFHSKSYVEALECSDGLTEEERSSHGLEFDCPVFPRMFDTVCQIAGASLIAAEELTYGHNKVAINWTGGWHHAQPGKADGFCYVNDCILSIQYLLQHYQRVLYVDLDLHHGNAVEAAFSCSPRVLTYSIHKHERGFYPGSGELASTGAGKGSGYSVNLPLKDGAGDATLHTVVRGTLDEVVRRFKPEAVVCQVGADGVAGDPHKSFYYTPSGLSWAVQRVVGYGLPTLLLGGGGYNLPNTARTWTKITGDLLGQPLSPDIPEHAHFESYGPSFELEVTAGPTRRDENTADYLEKLTETVNRNLQAVVL